MNENDEVREEPLLKTYLREAVEALRERAEWLEGEADEARCKAAYCSGEKAEVWTKEMVAVRQRLALTRAAMGFWERLAAAWRVEVVDHPDHYRHNLQRAEEAAAEYLAALEAARGENERLRAELEQAENAAFCECGNYQQTKETI